MYPNPDFKGCGSKAHCRKYAGKKVARKRICSYICIHGLSEPEPLTQKARKGNRGKQGNGHGIFQNRFKLLCPDNVTPDNRDNKANHQHKAEYISPHIKYPAAKAAKLILRNEKGPCQKCIRRQKMAHDGHKRCLSKKAHKPDKNAKMHNPPDKAYLKDLQLQDAVKDKRLNDCRNIKRMMQHLCFPLCPQENAADNPCKQK